MCRDKMDKYLAVTLLIATSCLCCILIMQIMHA